MPDHVELEAEKALRAQGLEAEATGPNVFWKVGDGWAIRYEGVALGIYKERGMGFIGQLVRRPKTWLSYKDLEAGLDEQEVRRTPQKGDEGMDQDEPTDKKKAPTPLRVMEWGDVRRARNKQREIECELQDTDDPAERLILNEEYARIDACLKEATKPGGKDGKGDLKTLDEDAKRRSSKVRKAIERAIRAIAGLDGIGGPLAAYLDAHIDKADGAAVYKGDITWET